MEQTSTVTSEELLSRVGNFGVFQILLLTSMAYSVLTLGSFASATPFFLVAEPRWRCATNSTICNITGTVGPGEENYNYRCSIPRQEWTFVDEYTSLITQVCKNRIAME